MKPWYDFPILLLLVMVLLGCRTAPKDEVVEGMPSHPLRNAKDLDVLMEKIGDSRIVLLGEASHGTTEYYAWRSAISKRLIQEKGFTIIGVEGEWADSYRVNNFVKGPSRDSLQAVAMLRQYDRWPTWMWGNYEIASLATWMNRYNQEKANNEKVGFFGLDVYCLWESMDELMPHIRGNDSLTKMAIDVRKCFQPYSADPGEYALGVATATADCRKQTERLYRAIMKFTGGATARAESQFVVQQNALVARNGENYYRTSVSSDIESWNVRDRHMMQTIKRLLELHGPDSKIIIWEHNTHVGDARFADMGSPQIVNVGQLVRQEYGRENVFIVGFGSHRGTVTAASGWGSAVETMRVPAAKKGSWEDVLNHAGPENRIIISDELRANKFYMKKWGHRAIGVAYNPNSEGGNYVKSVIPNRYDAFIYISQTTALRPIPILPRNEPPDTYPSGT
ncbi:MAG TPA: erythromycin esterase family protein [Flavobacterium sp.]|jgi:erythromycin esterase-like protein